MVGLVVSLAVAMEIHARGACPAAADIERRLAPLLGTGPDAHTTDVATIDRGADGALTVALDDAHGASIGARRLPTAGTCRDQAETVAVTLAIWEAQIHPEISLRLDRLSTGGEAAPTIVAAPGPAPPPAATLSLGAAVAGDWQEGTLAPAVRVAFGYGRVGSPWRARLALAGVGRHALDVAPGKARWRRAFAALGVERDLVRAGRWSLALGAAVVGGVAAISGAGFAVDHDTLSLDLGGEASLRVAARAGRLQPWLGVSALGWLRRQQLELQGVATTSALPRWEPMAALGADFLW
jgi:hypothetical protein